MQVDLKHTWRVRRKSWYVRFFLWLYETPETQVTFCKLFWGYALLWITLPVALIVKSLEVGVRTIKQVVPEGPPEEKPTVTIPKRGRVEKEFKPRVNYGFSRSWSIDGVVVSSAEYKDRPKFMFYERGVHVIEVRVQRNGKYETWKVEVEIGPPVLPLRIMSGVADGFVWLKMHSYVAGRVLRAVAWTVRVLARTIHWAFRKLKFQLNLASLMISFVVSVAGLALIATVAAGDAVRQAPVWLDHALPTMSQVAFGIGIVAVIGGLFLGVLWAALATPMGPAVGRGFVRAASPPVRGVRVAFDGLILGVKEFGQAMKIGYVAVKSNTCPRIEVVHEDEKK